MLEMLLTMELVDCAQIAIFPFIHIELNNMYIGKILIQSLVLTIQIRENFSSGKIGLNIVTKNKVIICCFL